MTLFSREPLASALPALARGSRLNVPMKLKRKSSRARESLFFSVLLSAFAVFSEVKDCKCNTCFAVFFSCVDAANCEAEQSRDRLFGLTS